MRCGYNDFEVMREAYIDSYIKGDIEMMAYLQHSTFINIKAGVVMNKLDFIKLMKIKIKRNSWYAPGSSYKYVVLRMESMGAIMDVLGCLSVFDGDQSIDFSIKELWVYQSETSWRLLTFVLLKNSI